MKQAVYVVVCVLALFASCNGENTRNKIESLPGMSEKIPFDQYTGYVTVHDKIGASRNLFYWFAESQNDPQNDPVVLWFTGGPGCSSLFGAFTENGPFVVKPNGKDLMYRDTSWNKLANMIWVESPCGVGFSYSDNGNYTTGDNQTARDAYHFVLGFFELFPEFTSNKFFVSGESYGGHYVPQVSLLLAESTELPVDFVGFSVGNPSTDNRYDFNGYITFIHGHALISDEDYYYVYEKCGKGHYYEFQNNIECSSAMYEMRSHIGKINPYDIYMPCEGPFSAHGGCFTADAMAGAGFKRSVQSQTVIPCINVTATRLYLRDPDVQKAIHVSPKSKIKGPWDVCSDVLNYVYSADSVLPIYKKLWSSKRILVYSGDVDSCVPWTGTQNSIDSLPLTISEMWRPWKVNNQVAGYVKSFEGQSSLTYATVKNAGHMVPTYQPEAAFIMYSHFLKGEPLPSF